MSEYGHVPAPQGYGIVPSSPQTVNSAASVGASAALERMAHDLRSLTLPYEIAGTQVAMDEARVLSTQVTDYIVPRLKSIDAPLLAVVGGSTGAGKSTLVNSILQMTLTSSSAIRPTTRRPLLVHSPHDAPWFEGDRVLASLARVRVDSSAPPTPPMEIGPAGGIREVEIRSSQALPPGLALLDAPDVDSVVDDNRDLATLLLASADLWLFVTTAARYADAVPWQHLHEAAQRNIVVAIILDRVPPGVENDIRADLRNRLNAAGLDQAPIFVVPEARLDERGMLPDQYIVPIRHWLTTLADDAAARSAVAVRSVVGAVESSVNRSGVLIDIVRRHEEARDELIAAATQAHEDAIARCDAATSDGTLLRGEVLARWQEYVGTGEFFRSLEAQVGHWRDRLGAALRGKPAPERQVEDAIESGLLTLALAETARATAQTERAWRRLGTAPEATAALNNVLPSEEQLTAQVSEAIRQWQGSVLAMVRSEGADKRFTARLLSAGINGVGVALMIVVFAHTGGLTGGEIGIAGGTAVVAQRMLEAVFGDQAMRSMAERARADLTSRIRALAEQRLAATLSVLPTINPSSGELHQTITEAITSIEGLVND
ncbi:dynamin family protein [Actinomyces vulturis]|uniref:dynamin family protein n=1 Tax=Actinomyces vulturis TaxID=1857645 RepID=UPI00082B53EF|nr:dynamin family protein [Actinomyces vulturis]